MVDVHRFAQERRGDARIAALAEAIAFDAAEVLEIRGELDLQGGPSVLVERLARLTARLEVRAREAFEAAAAREGV